MPTFRKETSIKMGSVRFGGGIKTQTVRLSNHHSTLKTHLQVSLEKTPGLLVGGRPIGMDGSQMEFSQHEEDARMRFKVKSASMNQKKRT